MVSYRSSLRECRAYQSTIDSKICVRRFSAEEPTIAYAGEFQGTFEFCKPGVQACPISSELGSFVVTISCCKCFRYDVCSVATELKAADRWYTHTMHARVVSVVTDYDSSFEVNSTHLDCDLGSAGILPVTFPRYSRTAVVWATVKSPSTRIQLGRNKPH